MKRILFCLLFLLAGILNVNAQTTGSITVGGDFNKFYPTLWTEGGWANNVASELEIGRSSAHTNSDWRGSLIAKFGFHLRNYGHGSNFINADIVQEHNSPENTSFIAGWYDATSANSTSKMIIWLRGGGTTYFYKSLFPPTPLVYDGVANTLPFQEQNGPAHSFKTSLDSYVNSNGLSKEGTAFFYGTGSNYFAGNMGIGARDTKGYKLAVEGNMIAESVKVQLKGAWADYVFDEDYKPQSLQEVAAFVKKNRHLPEIPSAEVIKNNGIDLGEMNAKLLKKIEELTLHLIEKDREVKSLIYQFEINEKENIKRNELLTELSKRIKVLEKCNEK